MADVALVLVCKRPGLGIGKQRLAASLGADAAYQIAQSVLACALEDARAWPGPVVIAPANKEDQSWAENLLPRAGRRVRVQPQADGNLGQRLNAVDQALRIAGLDRLVYIGTDAPALCGEDYAEACKALEDHDTVLIPSSDGGVVLMGSGKPWPGLGRLPWSTPELGASLAGGCRSKGQSVAIMPSRFDVDEEEDVIRLVTALSRDRRPARRALQRMASHLLQLREAGHVKV